MDRHGDDLFSNRILSAFQYWLMGLPPNYWLKCPLQHVKASNNSHCTREGVTIYEWKVIVPDQSFIISTILGWQIRT